MDAIRTCMAGALVMGPMVTLSSASQGAYVVTAHAGPAATSVACHPVDRGHATPSVHVVTRPVVAPGAVVSRGIAEQPVHDHLVEVNVNHTTIYLDPARDYRGEPGNRIDENHSILQAQRLHAALTAKGAHVVRNEHAAPEADEVVVMRDEIEPRAILRAPPRPQKNDARPAPIDEAPPRKSFPKVARAD